MNLLEAIAQAKTTGKAFKRPNWESAVYVDEDGTARFESSDDTMDFTASRARATDYVLVARDGADDESVTCVYDTKLGRYRSTTNADKHIAAGRKVARFVFDETLS